MAIGPMKWASTRPPCAIDASVNGMIRFGAGDAAWVGIGRVGLSADGVLPGRAGGSVGALATEAGCALIGAKFERSPGAATGAAGVPG